MGPLSHRVADLCAQVGPHLPGASGYAVAGVRQRLVEPLRIAIAGRLKSGKSTLVNALIGRRVAPTEVGECTRVVTQFRYGTTNRVDVVRRDGSRLSLPLDESGMIPQRLGVSRDEVAFVDVMLSSQRLADITVIDTPGLSSTNAKVSAGTQDFLFHHNDNADSPTGALNLDSASHQALSGAEAIIYVFTQAVREDDVAALEAFRKTSAKLATNPINSLGLFNKIDKLNTGDPWPLAEQLSHKQADMLRRQVADVVPIVGLLAETTEAGRLTAADCESLRQLAALPSSQRSVLLASVDLFVNRPCEVDTEQRRRLLELLDLYGISVAVGALADDPNMGTSELIKHLFQRSGFTHAQQTVNESLRWRADAIKASWALTALDQIAARVETRQREWLRSAIENLLSAPQFHQLRMIEAAQLVATGAVSFTLEMEQEIIRLALNTNPGEILQMPAASGQQIAHAALQAATRWRTFAVADATPAQARIAHVVHRGFYLLSQRISTPTGYR